MSNSYEQHVAPFTKAIERDELGNERRILMSADEVATLRRKEADAKQLASAIAARRAAEIAAKSDRRTELEKKRDQIANYTRELREKLEYGSTDPALQLRVNQFQKTLDELNSNVELERKEAQWRNDPDVRRMLENADTLKSARVIYDALPPEADDKINLAKAIAESRDFYSTADQVDAYFAVVGELSEMNLAGHRERTAQAESVKLQAEAALAKQQLAEGKAGGL